MESSKARRLERCAFDRRTTVTRLLNELVDGYLAKMAEYARMDVEQLTSAMIALNEDGRHSERRLVQSLINERFEREAGPQEAASP